jgi:hypothetical protein
VGRASPFSRRRAPLSSGAPVIPPYRVTPEPVEGAAITQGARQDLLDEQVGGLDAKTADLRQQQDHRMGAFLRALLQALKARLLDLSNLFADQAQPCHLATQLGQRMGRQWLSCGGAQSS